MTAIKQSRLETIQDLVREQPEGAFDELASALVEDVDPVVRWNAAAALANFPADEAVDALASTLVDQAEDPNVRRIAAWALGKLDDRNAERMLRAAFSDPEPAVRQAARLALQDVTHPFVGSGRRRSAGPTLRKGR